VATWEVKALSHSGNMGSQSPEPLWQHGEAEKVLSHSGNKGIMVVRQAVNHRDKRRRSAKLVRIRLQKGVRA
jgi:hypothetical protein